MREGVIGFTLGELGILAAFVLLFGYATEALNDTVPVSVADSLRSELQDARGERDSLSRAIQALRDSLRSASLPACQSVDVIDGYLFSALVIDRQQYVVGNDTLSFNGLRKAFASEIKTAQEQECRHQVRVRASQGLSAEMFIAAYNRLGRLFYIRASDGSAL